MGARILGRGQLRRHPGSRLESGQDVPGDGEAIEEYELHKYGKLSVGKDYFTTYEDDDKIIALHDSFDDALEYIYQTSAAVDRIEEIGGSWDVFKKCEFCNDWFTEYELNENRLCDHCEWYTKKGRC